MPACSGALTRAPSSWSKPRRGRSRACAATSPFASSTSSTSTPQAPVIRTVITWYDQPQSPLALEAFINVEDELQRADYQDLAQREELRFLFYDRALRHRLSKLVPNSDPETIRQIVATADRLRASIPEERFDFDAAKAAVMERHPL